MGAHYLGSSVKWNFGKNSEVSEKKQRESGLSRWSTRAWGLHRKNTKGFDIFIALSLIVINM